MNDRQRQKCSPCREPSFWQYKVYAVAVAIETAGAWNHLAIELVQEICRRIAAVTEEPRECIFLFQRLSVAFQRGDVVAFRERSTPSRRSHYLLNIFEPAASCYNGPKITTIITPG